MLDQGILGYPDQDILSWCDKLNAIEGVCTIQSCAGHGPETNGCYAAGHLWLRLDPVLSAAFEERVFELAQDTRHIERISKIYQSWGHEVTAIEFAGNGHALLTESMQVIYGFFESLAKRMARNQIMSPR